MSLSQNNPSAVELPVVNIRAYFRPEPGEPWSACEERLRYRLKLAGITGVIEILREDCENFERVANSERSAALQSEVSCNCAGGENPSALTNFPVSCAADSSRVAESQSVTLGEAMESTKLIPQSAREGWESIGGEFKSGCSDKSANPEILNRPEVQAPGQFLTLPTTVPPSNTGQTASSPSQPVCLPSFVSLVPRTFKNRTTIVV